MLLEPVAPVFDINNEVQQTSTASPVIPPRASRNLHRDNDNHAAYQTLSTFSSTFNQSNDSQTRRVSEVDIPHNDANQQVAPEIPPRTGSRVSENIHSTRQTTIFSPSHPPPPPPPPPPLPDHLKNQTRNSRPPLSVNRISSAASGNDSASASAFNTARNSLLSEIRNVAVSHRLKVCL